jgi:hypothetical protein
MKAFRFRGGTRRAARAVVDAMVPRFRDNDVDLTEPVLARMEKMLSGFPPFERFGIGVAVRLLNWSGPLFFLGLRPLTALDRRARYERLVHLAEGSSMIGRRLVKSVNMICNLCAFSLPEVERQMGVYRPEWRASRRAFRDRLLAADAARDALPVVPAPLGSDGLATPDTYLLPRPEAAPPPTDHPDAPRHEARERQAPE